VIGLLVAALVGLIVGGALCRFAAQRTSPVPPLSANEPSPTADRPPAGPTAEEALAELRQTWQKRRHDVRGALSPALLTADRLTSHQDEQVRRAGQIVVLSLERAIAALADPARPGQE
jgi:hypothetical protein